MYIYSYIYNERMAKRVYEYDVRGIRRRGRNRKCWLDGVQEVLAREGLNIQEEKVRVQDRNEWRSTCRGLWHDVGESPAGCMEAARWLAVEAQVLLGFTPKDNGEE